MPVKKGVNVLPKGKVAIKLKNSPINEKSPKSGDINPCPEGKVLNPKTGKCIKAKPEPNNPVHVSPLTATPCSFKSHTPE